jgi:hypothetical protein
MGTPGSPPTRLTVVPNKWVRPTRRPADLLVDPADLVGGLHDLLKDLPEDSSDDLIQNDVNTWHTRQDISGFQLSIWTGYGKSCNQLDFGLQVVTDQESGNRAHPLANIRRTRRPLYYTQSSSNLHRQLDVGYYSPEARTSINSSCSLCFVCSCATLEFLALDSTSPNN